MLNEFVFVYQRNVATTSCAQWGAYLGIFLIKIIYSEYYVHYGLGVDWWLPADPFRLDFITVYDQMCMLVPGSQEVELCEK